VRNMLALAPLCWALPGWAQEAPPVTLPPVAQAAGTQEPGTQEPVEVNAPVEDKASQDAEPPLDEPADVRVVLGEPLADDASAAELHVALAELAQRNVDWIELRELGLSAAGRPIVMVVIGDGRAGRRAEQPGVLIVPDLMWHGREPSQRAYELVRALLSWSASASAQARSSGATFYVVPTPCPDRFEPEQALESGAGVDLERNFSVGWDPWWAGAASAGPFPLSEPETESLARFALSQPSLCAAVILTPLSERGARRATTPLQSDDLAYVEEFTSDLVHAPDIHPGSLAAFLSGQAGVFVLRVDPLRFDAFQSLGDAPAVGPELAQVTTELLDHLAHVELSEPVVERLGGELWQVELSASNGGRLASASPVAIRNGHARGLQLSVIGGTVAAAAQTDDASAGARYEVVDHRAETVQLADLEAGASLHLRLLITAPEQTAVVVRLVGSRAGRAERALTLE
jgi:hypothetical protein